MKIISLEQAKVSLTECRKIMNTRGVKYTDEEIIEIRDWLYHIIDIMLDVQEQNKEKALTEQTLKQAA